MTPALLRLTLAGAALLASLLVTALLLAAGNDSQSSKQAAANMSATGFSGSKLPDGYRAPPLELDDQDGHEVASRSLRGQPTLITFTYSTCQESCPSQIQLIRSALDELSTEIPAYAISVAPRVDTRSTARKFLAKQRVLGRVSFLLGSERRLSRVWRGFGVQPQRGRQDHHARIVLLDSTGAQRVGYSVGQVTGKQIARDIERLKREQS